MFYSYEVFCVILYIKVETNCKNFLGNRKDEILCLQEDGFFSIHDIFGTMRKSIERIKHVRFIF